MSHYSTWQPIVEDKFEDEDEPTYVPDIIIPDMDDLPSEIPTEGEFKEFYKEHAPLVITSISLFGLLIITLVCCVLRYKKMRSETYVFKTYSEIDKVAPGMVTNLNQTLGGEEDDDEDNRENSIK